MTSTVNADPVRHLSRAAPSDADPRVARTRARVLRAATDLLVDGGPTAVTIEAIVATSGVARSTIYRHWDTRDDILLSVIESCAPVVASPPESAGFEESLRLLVEDLRVTLTDPGWTRVLPAILALKHQEHGVADLEQRLEERQEHVLEIVLRRGIDEGSLDPDIDLEAASALLIGPLLFSMLTGKPELDAAFCSRVVDAFLQVHAVRERPRTGPAGARLGA